MCRLATHTWRNLFLIAESVRHWFILVVITETSCAARRFDLIFEFVPSWSDRQDFPPSVRTTDRQHAFAHEVLFRRVQELRPEDAGPVVPQVPDQPEVVRTVGRSMSKRPNRREVQGARFQRAVQEFQGVFWTFQTERLYCMGAEEKNLGQRIRPFGPLGGSVFRGRANDRRGRTGCRQHYAMESAQWFEFGYKHSICVLHSNLPGYSNEAELSFRFISSTNKNIILC